MKRGLSFLFIFGMLIFCLSCGKKAEPLYQSVTSLAELLYSNASIADDGVYSEPIERDSAYLFHMNIADFEEKVESGVVCRRLIGSDGQLLYSIETKTEDLAMLLAEDYYNNYEFVACDKAEKLVIGVAGKYVLLFKSSEAEADSVIKEYKRLSGGKLAYERERMNKG